jgi:hypothetical protein
VVNELGNGNVCIVAKDVDILEVGRAVLEPEADKVTDVGGRATTEVNGKSSGVVGCWKEDVRSLRQE